MLRRVPSAFRAAIAIALLSLVASACNGSSEGDNPSSTTGDKPSSTTQAQATTTPTEESNGEAAGTVLALGIDGLPEVLAPSSTTSYSTYLVNDQIFDPLVRLDPEGGTDIAPALAESWDVSDDRLTYTFHLRNGVTFHDGSILDAEAVRLNYERLTDPNSPYYWAQGGEVAVAQVLHVVDTLEVVDQDTVRIVLSGPFPDFLANLARPYFMFISPTTIKELSPEDASNASIGTGPFQLVDREEGSFIQLAAFDNYYEGAPSVDELLIRPYADANASLSALESGEVDMITTASYDDLDRLSDQFDPWTYGTEDALIVAFNFQHPFTKDVKVRQALNLAVDKESLVDGLFGGKLRRAEGPYSPSNPAFNDGLQGYGYDPELAKSMLADAGYADGISVKAIVPSNSGIPLLDEFAQTIQADWAQVGVNVEFDIVEWNAYLDVVGSGIPEDYIFYITAWGSRSPSWLELLHGEASQPPNGPNRGWYSNPDVEALFDQARGEPDTEQRIALYRDAEKQIVADAPWLYTVYVRFFGLKKPEVIGIRNEMLSFDLAKVSVGG